MRQGYARISLDTFFSATNLCINRKRQIAFDAFVVMQSRIKSTDGFNILQLCRIRQNLENLCSSSPNLQADSLHKFFCAITYVFAALTPQCSIFINNTIAAFKPFKLQIEKRSAFFPKIEYRDNRLPILDIRKVLQEHLILGFFGQIVCPEAEE